jgi:hypothetical protein
LKDFRADLTRQKIRHKRAGIDVIALTRRAHRAEKSKRVIKKTLTDFF